MSDERLLAEFLGGDEQAFADLVRRYSSELFTFVLRFVRSASTAEDVVQETLLQVHQSADSFDTDRRFRPWLFTIAANKARDHLRSKSRRREVSVDAASSGTEGDGGSFLDFMADESLLPEDRVEAGEEARIVREIVDQMPPHLREVLVLGYYQRFPYKEIAEVLSIPLGTVKSRLHAAVAHFAQAYRRSERTGPTQEA